MVTMNNSPGRQNYNLCVTAVIKVLHISSMTKNLVQTALAWILDNLNLGNITGSFYLFVSI